MKRHKESEPEHEYCSRCDVDFADEMRFLVHKLRSEKHIACPVCGLDFRSAGGRDGHIRQVRVIPENYMSIVLDTQLKLSITYRLIVPIRI